MTNNGDDAKQNVPQAAEEPFVFFSVFLRVLGGEFFPTWRLTTEDTESTKLKNREAINQHGGKY